MKTRLLRRGKPLVCVVYSDEETIVEAVVNHWFVLYAVMKTRVLKLW